MEFTTENVRNKALGKFDSRLSKFFSSRLFTPLPKPKQGEWLHSAKKESGQTFQTFQIKSKKPDHTHNIIYIQPLDFIPPDMISYLNDYCSVFFLGISVKVLPEKSLGQMNIENRLNYGELQYHAGKIIEELKVPSNGYCLIAITMQDLYPRDSWNFVFGLAKGNKGVFSFARFWSHDLSQTDAEELRLFRAARTLTHEVSHMFGLKHCIFYYCLMNGSNSLEESAGKPAHLCCVCLHKLYDSLKFDIAERYVRLIQVTNRPFDSFQRQIREYEALLK